MHPPATRRRATLRARIIRTTVTNVVATAVGIGAWSIAGAWTADRAAMGAAPREQAVVHVDRVQSLMERHHCWSGAAPDGTEPGHALVTRPGERARIVRASVGLGIWLEGDPGALHAFCR